jgi:hypothetical protein
MSVWSFCNPNSQYNQNNRINRKRIRMQFFVAKPGVGKTKDEGDLACSTLKIKKVLLYAMMSCIGSNSIIVLLLVNMKQYKTK